MNEVVLSLASIIVASSAAACLVLDVPFALIRPVLDVLAHRSTRQRIADADGAVHAAYQHARGAMADAARSMRGSET